MLDSSQSTAFHLQGLISQRIQEKDDQQQQQQQQKPTSKGVPRSSTMNFREMHRKQQASKDEVELQKQTEKLIQDMHDEASAGNIPEYGKRIIDVLLNYQGKIFKKCKISNQSN